MTNDQPKFPTEEIFTILTKKIGNSNFELINYDLKRPNDKIGLLGDHCLLSATVNIFTNDESRTKSLESYTFFVKFFPQYKLQAEFCRETGAFGKEVFMYSIFEEIRSKSIQYIDTTSKCYFSKNNYALVLENLSEKDYKLIDKMRVLDYDTVLVVLKSLAKLHASGLIYEEMKSEELERPYRLLEDHEDDFEETFYNDREGFINIKGVQASLKGIYSEIDLFNIPKQLESGKNFKEVLEKHYRHFYDLVKRKNKPIRNVLCHGDLWATNFLLKFDDSNKPIDCKFVDFQYGRYLPPSHDVMSLLYLTTSREFRKNHLYEILGLYYTYLEKYLKLSNVNINNILSIQDFLTSCEEQKFFALFQTATYFQLVLVDDEKLQEFFADENNINTIEEDRTPLVLGSIDGNQIYETRLRESVLDLKEYCDLL